MIEIKSSLLNHSDFKNVKNSIIKVSEKDGKDKFRVKLIEYINDSSDTNNDIFFYDMLEFVRFLDPSDDSIAYTTPDHLIYLNAPDGGKIGEKYRQWDFTYDHECLHQLWETFKIADKIKEKYGSYNHMLLNVASDCVINDYLYFYRKKDMPDGLITPEYLESEYGVKYDRKIDTQFTLYIKLKEAIENNKNLQNKMQKDKKIQQSGGEDQPDPNQSQSGDGDQNNNQSNSGQSSGEQSSNNKSNNNQSGSGENQSGENQSNKGQDQSESPENQAKKSAKEAQDAADKAKDAAGDNKDKKDATDRAQKAADKAKEEADKAKEAAENGDKEGAKEHADAAKKAEQEAKDAAKEAGVEEKNLKDNKSSDNKKGGNESSNDLTEIPEDLEKIRKKAGEIIEKYRNRISGEFGKFISKCKYSGELKESGLAISSKSNTQVPGWNQQMNATINAFVKNKVFKKKREIELTFKRMPRRSGFVKVGDPLKKGKRIKKQLLTINVAFYIDRSGSMGGEPINNVFKAAYTICESLKKQFSHEKVVDDIAFKIHAFDYNIHEIKFGSTMNADGGTLEFHKLVKYIKDNTNDYLINIIITDAGFSDINETEIDKFINDIDGLMLFITNTDNDKMINISKKHDTKLTYILADQSFTIK